MAFQPGPALPPVSKPLHLVPPAASLPYPSCGLPGPRAPGTARQPLARGPPSPPVPLWKSLLSSQPISLG